MLFCARSLVSSASVCAVAACEVSFPPISGLGRLWAHAPTRRRLGDHLRDVLKRHSIVRSAARAPECGTLRLDFLVRFIKQTRAQLGTPDRNEGCACCTHTASSVILDFRCLSRCWSKIAPQQLQPVCCAVLRLWLHLIPLQ